MWKKFWHKFWHQIVTRNKFIITLIVFVLWVFFFDKNNLLERRKYIRQLEQLRKDKRYYENKIRRDSARLHELRNNPERLERFAREHYYMKEPDEEIFIIQKKEKETE